MQVFMVIGALCAGVFQEPAAPQGPAAYYKLDELNTAGPVVDTAGGVNGTYVGPPTVSTVVPGPPITYQNLRSLNFNGTSQAVNVPSFGTFQNFTVSTWVSPASSTVAGRRTIVSYKENTSNGFVLNLNETGLTGLARIHVNIATIGWRSKEGPTVVPVAPAWTHLAASYDGTTIRLYINGTEQVAPVVTVAGLMTNTATDSMALGGRNSYNQHWYPGLIDDVRIYSRALTALEVSVLAAGCPVPTALTATPAINQVMLGWGAPTGPAVTYTYNVKRKPTPSPPTAYVTVATVNGLTYTDNVFGGGNSYDYIVTALSVAESGPSNTQTVVPLSPPPRTQQIGNDNKCSCGSIALPGWSSLGVVLLALLLLLPFQRR